MDCAALYEQLNPGVGFLNLQQEQVSPLGFWKTTGSGDLF